MHFFAFSAVRENHLFIIIFKRTLVKTCKIEKNSIHAAIWTTRVKTANFPRKKVCFLENLRVENRPLRVISQAPRKVTRT